jgi:hypothetical protein
MYASFKSFTTWPPSRENARRFTLLLCICSTLGCLLVYWSSMTLPLGLLALNMAALACVWIQYRLSRKSIKFQPQELADRLLEVQENERHRLSRELHDDIGQLLTAAKLQSEWLKRRMPQELQDQCAVLSETLDETLNKVRDVSAILNPRQLTSLGLEASLRAHLLKTLANTPVNWSLDCQQRMTGIPEEMTVAAFRITQEAVTNPGKESARAPATAARGLDVSDQRRRPGIRPGRPSRPRRATRHGRHVGAGRATGRYAQSSQRGRQRHAYRSSFSLGAPRPGAGQQE